MALHIRILASGFFLQISRTASMPPMSGITISMVTRSGLSWRYRSTAWAPVSASPMTSYPAWVRMSVVIVRMKNTDLLPQAGYEVIGEDVGDHCAHEDRVVAD